MVEVIGSGTVVSSGISGRGNISPIPVFGIGSIPVITTNESTVMTYQFTNETTVTINHNRGRYVVVEIVDASGQQIYGDVDNTSLNQIVVTFSQTLSGTIIID